MTAAPTTTRADVEPVLGPSMYASPLFAAMAAIVILVTLDVAAYTYGGAPLFATTVGTSVVAFAGWMRTTFRRPASEPAALSLYIATVAALVVFYGEQWSGDFSSRLVQLYPGSYPPGIGITNHAFVAVFPLAGSALLLAGALTYYHGTAFGRFAAWLTFAWAAIDALAIYLYPLLAGGRMSVVPGMLTAPLPLVIALLGIRALIRREGLRSATS
jgi:hypothetical protein